MMDSMALISPFNYGSGNEIFDPAIVSTIDDLIDGAIILARIEMEQKFRYMAEAMEADRKR